MYDVNSNFPDKIDDLVHFSDITYSKRLDTDGNDIEAHHKELLEAGTYTAASEYLNGLTGVTLYVANLFNMIINRIKALQEYLLNKGVRNIFVLNDEKPVSPSENTIWTSGGTLNDDTYENAEFEIYNAENATWNTLNLKTSADCVYLNDTTTLQDTLGDIKGIADSYDIEEEGYATDITYTKELYDLSNFKFDEKNMVITIDYDGTDIVVGTVDGFKINSYDVDICRASSYDCTPLGTVNYLNYQNTSLPNVYFCFNSSLQGVTLFINLVVTAQILLTDKYGNTINYGTKSISTQSNITITTNSKTIKSPFDIYNLLKNVYLNTTIPNGLYFRNIVATPKFTIIYSSGNDDIITLNGTVLID